jgi:hypothetical protein
MLQDSSRFSSIPRNHYRAKNTIETDASFSAIRDARMLNPLQKLQKKASSMAI